MKFLGSCKEGAKKNLRSCSTKNIYSHTHPLQRSFLLHPHLLFLPDVGVFSSSMFWSIIGRSTRRLRRRNCAIMLLASKRSYREVPWQSSVPQWFLSNQGIPRSMATDLMTLVITHGLFMLSRGSCGGHYIFQIRLRCNNSQEGLMW